MRQPRIEGQQPAERRQSCGVPVVQVRRASEIAPVPMEWLWRDHIPLGTLTMMSGDPKLGKSFATISLISFVTRGGPPPGEAAGSEPGSVMLLSGEDDAARTIVPRLRSAGAELSKVHILSSIVEQERTRAGDVEAVERMLTVRGHDLKAIERTAESLGDCRLIVIDPVSAFLGDCDEHRSTSVRSVLGPLNAVAKRLNAAIVLISHNNKAATGATNGKYRVLGSIAYVGTCRANFLFLKDPGDPGGRRVLMLDNGVNLADRRPALAYVIRDSDEGPYCDWQPGTIDLDADTALAEAARAQRIRRRCAPANGPRPDECEEWLRGYLDRRTRPASDCLAEGTNRGFHRRAIQRARERIGATVSRVGFGSRGAFLWAAPNAVPDDAGLVSDHR